MAGERRREDVAASASTPATADRPETPRMSRRQALGRMSALATTGAVAWVVPEILTAKPAAAGAPLSGTTAGGLAGVPGAIPATSDATTTGTTEPPLVTLAGALASTGLDLQRDAEIGVALVAGGWAMRHWASRTSESVANGAPEPAADAGSAAPAE